MDFISILNFTFSVNSYNFFFSSSFPCFILSLFHSSSSQSFLLAVQDEALKKEKKETGKRKVSSGSSSTSKGSPVEVTSSRVEMPLIPIDSIISAESMVDPAIPVFANTSVDPIRHVCLAADKQVWTLIFTAILYVN